jgi:DNA repair photolyase
MAHKRRCLVGRSKIIATQPFNICCAILIAVGGKGVVLLCSGTDPYQNKQTAGITRSVVEILLKYNKRVRILTRSPLWVEDLDILNHKDVTVGMSLPYLDDELSRQIEPFAPPPSVRYKALLEGAAKNCRLYVAIAPTSYFDLFFSHYNFLSCNN